jgi:hypothetical protein
VYKYLFLLFCSISYSQITSSTVSGSISKPIPNIKIVLIHTPTNYSVETITDSKGRFSLDNLEVGGPYTLLIEKEDLLLFKKSGLEFHLGDNDFPKPIEINF